MRKCSKCGQLVQDTDLHCTRCGSDTIGVSDVQQKTHTKKSKSMEVPIGNVSTGKISKEDIRIAKKEQKIRDKQEKELKKVLARQEKKDKRAGVTKATQLEISLTDIDTTGLMRKRKIGLKAKSKEPKKVETPDNKIVGDKKTKKVEPKKVETKEVEHKKLETTDNETAEDKEYKKLETVREDITSTLDFLKAYLTYLIPLFGAYKIVRVAVGGSGIKKALTSSARAILIILGIISLSVAIILIVAMQ